MAEVVAVWVEVQCSCSVDEARASRLRGEGRKRIECSIPRSGEGSGTARRGVWRTAAAVVEEEEDACAWRFGRFN